jgi:acetylornithine deacetylase/succinyl-diaminopimelate desuccinylase-like protein
VFGAGSARDRHLAAPCTAVASCAPIRRVVLEVRHFDTERRWVDELSELLRIPSISSDADHDGDVRDAATWIVSFIESAGGRARLVPTERHPLVVGEMAASTDLHRAPTVMLYGHFDVQPVGNPLDWTSPPFEPSVRDDWLYSRGATDDKGNLFMLLKATELLASAHRLPVNVVFACDGEEECGGDSIVKYIEQDQASVDAAVLFDGPMPADGQVAFKVATRGLVYFHILIRTARRDLHSGMYGGAALNAVHALITTLDSVRGLPPQLRGQPASIGREEWADWQRLPAGEAALGGQGALPADASATSEFYLRTMAQTSLDVHGISAGEANLTKTIVPALAEATFSLRLVPGQDPDAVVSECVALLHAAAPKGTELEIDVRSATPPAVTDPASRVIHLGLDAFERALGQRPLLLRSGGSVPVRGAFSTRGIPTIHTGFDVPSGNAHAPDERLYLPYLGAGVAAATALLTDLRALRSD